MSRVLIVYASTYSNTKKMAEAVEDGSQQFCDTMLKQASATTIEDLKQADALVLGSPVHMGSMDWEMKKFIDEVCSPLWMKDQLIGKVGAVFASGGGFGSAGGGCELTMLAMIANLCELGLYIVPLPKNTKSYAYGGHHFGPYGRSAGLQMEQTGVQELALEVAKEHGKNIAQFTKKLFS